MSTTAWCNVTLPLGNTYGPVLGPMNITVGSGMTLSRVRAQSVPASAPAGIYHYNAFAVAAGDTSKDSFVFTKLGFGDWGLGIGGWTNTGEEFDEATSFIASSSGSGSTPTTEISPNPFNATTVASFELRVPSHISLKVYDTAGRLVATLVDGWREAGRQEATFDGSRLVSGLYFVRMQAGDFCQVQKLVLLK